ncbi:MAG: GPMC system MBL fold metallohydrolase [Nitrospirota bacterium]|nr:GPMC system MBL fold metallohydrolase [Nitrospirota bacterium]
MEVVILGSGTSTGVPVIGCSCEVCTSDDPRNRRTRSSILVEHAGAYILVDTATDFRAQAIANNIPKIDAVCYTHTHADHVHGIDDLRCFNKLKGGAIPCYGSPATCESLQRNFPYIFKPSEGAGWRPHLEPNAVTGDFDLFGLKVAPIEIEHGKSMIYGYRFGDVAYLTDCSGIPGYSMEKLRGLKLLIIGAIRYQPHPSHFSLGQSVEIIEALKPERALLTHLGHSFDQEKTGAELPPNTGLAYDGLRITL